MHETNMVNFKTLLKEIVKSLTNKELSLDHKSVQPVL